MSDVYDHPDYRAFVGAIAAAPDDDTPRLACADWLEEHGEHGRAELVRVQCESARVPRCELAAPAGVCDAAICSTCPGRRPLDVRETELLDRHSRGWVGMPAGVGHTVVKWERGFVDQLKCSAAAWLAHADAVLALHPVRRVWLTTWPEGNALKVERQRPWKVPPKLGGHVLDCWRAEWPGVVFEQPTLAGQLPDWPVLTNEFRAAAADRVRGDAADAVAFRMAAGPLLPDPPG